MEKKVIYYIYEIFGKKVGCTKNLKQRMIAQKAQDNHRVIITTPDKICAGVLERYWQEKLGYKVDRDTYSVSAKFGEAGKGKTYSEETRRKIGEGHRGKTISDKAKERISTALTGNKNNYGKGKLYKELSTGFEGYFNDQRAKFGLWANFLHPTNLGKVKKFGKFKGMCWVEI